MSHVVAQRGLPQTVQLVQPTQTKFSVVESRVNLRVDVLRVQLLDERPPRRPPHTGWKEVLFFGESKVALVRNQGGVGKQEAERTLATLSMVAFLRVGGGAVHGAFGVLLAAHIFLPELWLKQESWDGLEEYPARCPHEMHVHPLRDQDVPAEKKLMVQRARRHGPTREPQQAVNARQPVQVELRVDAGDNMTGRGCQIIGFGAERRVQKRCEIFFVAVVLVDAGRSPRSRGRQMTRLCAI